MNQTMMIRIAETQAAERRKSDAPPTPKADFEAVRDASFQLQRAAQRVLDSDARQGRDAVAEIARRHPEMQTVIGYLVADGERAARTDLDEAEASVRSVISERLNPHSHVPERLETQRDEALDQASTLDGTATTAQELRSSGTWQGEAAQAYRTTAATQVGALEEYSSITRESASYLDEAALLHRATFFLCAESLRTAARQIEALSNSDAGHLFSRTRQAISLLNSAAGQLSRDIDGALHGAPASELARGMERLARGTEFLTGAEWPKGGEPTA